MSVIYPQVSLKKSKGEGTYTSYPPLDMYTHSSVTLGCAPSVVAGTVCLVHSFQYSTRTRLVCVPSALWGGTWISDGTALKTVVVRVVLSTVLMTVTTVAAVNVELKVRSDHV